jgi:hypothetical protein
VPQHVAGVAIGSGPVDEAHGGVQVTEVLAAQVD